MSKFTPDIGLYGRPVTFLNENGEPTGQTGTLNEIRGPFTFVIDGVVYCTGETDKFFEDFMDGDLCIQNPERIG